VKAARNYLIAFFGWDPHLSIVIESRCLIALVSALVSLHSAAETVPDRKGAVLQDRANLENDVRWIYDDFEHGIRSLWILGARVESRGVRRGWIPQSAGVGP
jgi:hypothetical protein